MSQILDCDDNTRSCDVSIIGLCTNDNYKYAKDALDAEHANKLKEILILVLMAQNPIGTGYSIRTIHQYHNHGYTTQS